MAGQSGEDSAGAVEILAKLRAAERMGEGVDSVDRFGVARSGDGGDLLGGPGDAADGGQDPDLVARSDPAVGAAIALEGQGGGFGHRVGRCRGGGLVAVGERTAERGCEVVDVDVFAGADHLGEGADREPELAHGLPFVEAAQSDLVALRHGIADGDDRVADLQALARDEGAQRDRDVVFGVETQHAQPGSGERFGLQHMVTGVRYPARRARARLGAARFVV
jgi:hypothetical protein